MSKATETAVKMIESLPEQIQERVVEELRNLVEEARDEAKWDALFERKKAGLVTAARKARKAIATRRFTHRYILSALSKKSVSDRFGSNYRALGILEGDTVTYPSSLIP